MAVNSRTLEIKVISAENLQLDRKPTKKNASVAVRSDINTQFRTKDMDTKGGGPATVEREAHARLANALEVHHGGGPMQDFVRCQDDRDGDDSSIGFCWRLSAGGLPAFLSYRLRNHKGERNGIINIFVRMKVPEMYPCASSTTWSHSTMGFPAAGNNSFGNGGIATGVPVWYG